MPSGPVVGPRTRSSERAVLVLVLVVVLVAIVRFNEQISIKFLQKPTFRTFGDVFRQSVRVVYVLCS